MQPYLLILLRTVAAFVLALIASRFVGQPLKVVSGIALGALTAWTILDHNEPVYYGLMAMAMWALLNVGVRFFAMKSMPFRNLVNGKATPLVQNGKVMDQNVRKSRLTVDDVMTMLRTKDAFKLADVEFAALEPDGNLSVLLKSDSQPLTPKTMNLPVSNESTPAVVILDGQVLPDALANLGYSRAWLLEQIRPQGATTWEDVFVAQVDSKGQVYVDLYSDLVAQPSAPPNQKQLVFTSLKKIQADLELFSLQTNNSEAKADYDRHAQALKSMIQYLTPHMR